jgi:serine/alanine adding enzyme
LILREVEGTGFYDATSAYGYGGPWVEGQPDLANFVARFEEWAKSNNVVATFTRFHPLLENAKLLHGHLPLIRAGSTAVWNLQHDEPLLNRMSKSHRKNWRRATKAGIKARISVRPRNLADRFRETYETSMARLSATSFYWFPDTYWESLQTLLHQESVLVEAVHEDRVVAAVWGLATSDYFHFHLSGTTDEGRDLGGAFVCRVAAAEWAQEAGIKYAHHGGGAGGEDSPLLAWKRRFDETTPLQDFYISKMVHLDDQYLKLSNGAPSDGYFPPWRAPRADNVQD